MRLRHMIACGLLVSLEGFYVLSYLGVRATHENAPRSVLFNSRRTVERAFYYGYYPLIVIDRLSTGQSITLDGD